MLLAVRAPEAAAAEPKPAKASAAVHVGDSDSDSDSDLTAYISGKDSDLTAADVDTSDSDAQLALHIQKCSISGKEGMGCPISTFISIQMPVAKMQAKVGAESGFMAGKSLIAAVEKAPSSHDGWLTKVCPLHWDEEATSQAFMITAAVCSLSGVAVVGSALYRYCRS